MTYITDKRGIRAKIYQTFREIFWYDGKLPGTPTINRHRWFSMISPDMH